ncbi:MAG TPA: DUF6089 family protein [Sphingobacteriaceae bacterium]|nr:DUF6089 family protein [Sphingobacteriaceae bacterium]
MRRFLLLLYFFGLFSDLLAQSWEVGGFGGSSGYMGDINPDNPLKFTDIAFGGQVKRNIDPYWSFKLSAMHGKIRGDDAKSSNEYQQQRNLNFNSDISEVSIQTEFNLFNYIPGVSKKIFTPYIFTGIAGIAFNPKTTYNGREYELANYSTEGLTYKNYALAIPYGVGIKYNVTRYWNLIGEVGYRTALTDYLDDLSMTYPDKNSLINNDARALSDRSGENTGIYFGAAGTQRGDFRKRDNYMFAGISLTYTFVSQKCYSW